jgi:16S rRNA C967 or C1407 C5-methylase (RsmB/RsmF family)
MSEGSRLLQTFSQRLFDQPTAQQPQPNALLWTQTQPVPHPFAIAPPLPWQPIWLDRLAAVTTVKELPAGQHPLHDQGAYYCLDFASVIAASVLLSIPSPIGNAIDLCAAPGGKSVFLWRSLQPEQLLCNEAIGKRVGRLIGNLKRCRVHPVSVYAQDPQRLVEQVGAWADVVLVDAPCTGQSLLAKGKAVPGCFHPVTIRRNANRQRRIIANAAGLVAPGGYLAYMTCAFSREENEQVLQWFLRQFPMFGAIAVPHLAALASSYAEFPCYRVWPQSGLGAGAFTALLQHQGVGARSQPVLGIDEFAGCRWRSN